MHYARKVYNVILYADAAGVRLEYHKCAQRAKVGQESLQDWTLNPDFCVLQNAGAIYTAISVHYEDAQCTETTVCDTSKVVTGHVPKKGGAV